MGILSKLAALASARNATADAFGLINQLREEAAEVRAEIRRISDAPQPVEDAMAAFDAWAQTVATAAIDNLHPRSLLDAREAAQGLRLPTVFAKVGDQNVRDHGASVATLLGLVVATSMPALRKHVQGQLEDFTLGVETLSPATRAKRIAAAEARLLEIEMAEESAIRALEATGLTVERRPDVDPRVVLAADGSLPA